LWFDGYVRTYLERDLQQLAQIEALVDFRRLMRASALRSAGLLNQADLARDAGLSPATAYRYLNLLEVSYQIHRLPAYSVNRTKRLIKAPKLYWTDTGLAAFLAGVDRHSLGDLRPALFETLLLGELLSWREREVPRPDVSYWRTAAGEEVDFIVEWKNRLLPIEVKSAERAKPAHAKAVESFVREYGDTCRFGVVVYTGSDVHLLAEHVIAVPLRLLI
jgi:predicted AAA+ superfamily ATPase